MIAHENRRWTADAVIAAIQRYAREFGHPPKATAWQVPTRPSYCPPSSAVYRSGGTTNRYAPFETWADAIEAAGFPRPTVGHRAGERRWTRELVLSELRAIAARDGLARSADDHVLAHYASEFFGSWRDACAAAGVMPAIAARRQWTPDDVIAALQACADGPLAPKVLVAGSALVTAAITQFGSWKAAVEAAGLIHVPKTRGARQRLKDQLHPVPDRMPVAETTEATTPTRRAET